MKKKQNPEEIKEQVRQVSEFEKKELFDPNQIAALIDKSKTRNRRNFKEKAISLHKAMLKLRLYLG